jgi:hypothetical protein
MVLAARALGWRRRRLPRAPATDRIAGASQHAHPPPPTPAAADDDDTHTRTCARRAPQVARLQYHTSLVRDCSWHPYEPELTSVSWDGRVVSWAPQPPARALPRGHQDVLRGYF